MVEQIRKICDLLCICPASVSSDLLRQNFKNLAFGFNQSDGWGHCVCATQKILWNKKTYIFFCFRTLIAFCFTIFYDKKNLKTKEIIPIFAQSRKVQLQICNVYQPCSTSNLQPAVDYKTKWAQLPIEGIYNNKAMWVQLSVLYQI